MDLRLVTHNDLEHLVTDGGTNLVRFEFYLCRKIAGMIESGKVYVSESERDKRLERLSNSIEHTLADLESRSLLKSWAR